MLEIRKAKRYQKKAKVALLGPSGSGKTMSALKLAAGLAAGGKILLLDTERSSATLYAEAVEFDHADIEDYSYETFLAGIAQAEKLQYPVLIIDSVSHAWEAFLEAHEREAARVRNSFAAWAKITPQYNQLINAIIAYPGHCIVTMRSKTEYVLEKNDKGKETPRKVGLAAVMRPGVEYEFDVVGQMDLDHNMAIEKTRFDWLADKIVKKPDQKLGAKIAEWLNGGAAPEPKPQPAPVAAPQNGAVQKTGNARAETERAIAEGRAFIYSPFAKLSEAVKVAVFDKAGKYGAIWNPELRQVFCAVVLPPECDSFLLSGPTPTQRLDTTTAQAFPDDNLPEWGAVTEDARNV